MTPLAVIALALAAGGCESNQELSAQLEKQAKLQRARNPAPTAKGLTIARASRTVQVVTAQAVHSSEGTAAVVTLRNTSPRALRGVPIAITVRGAHGAILYQNNSPGLETALTSVPLLPAGTSFTWIDDQVQSSEGAGGTPTVSAVVGEAPPASGPVPQVTLAGVHANEEGGSSGIAGTVHDDSAIPQRSLVVYGLARRGTQVVAAGRAVLSEVPAHGSTPFQVLLIGSAAGARVEASAPPSTL